MKIILSRKGFDSSHGRTPSPIFPSGRMLSLPIPERDAPRRRYRYAGIKAGNEGLGQLVSDLTGGRIVPGDWAHLDPDLRLESAGRKEGWKPVFGQSGAAESHLRNHQVGPGDLFLFFGWFRQVERKDGMARYVAGSPDFHSFFGWLQVGQRIHANDRDRLPDWAAEHAHAMPHPDKRPDALYLAGERLKLPGIEMPLAGGGTFPCFRPSLRLTAPGQKRSLWQLPSWFHPQGRPSALTYHGDPRRWTPLQDSVLLQTVGRGQEFVLDVDHYPEAIAWVASLLWPESGRPAGRQASG